MTAYAWIGDRQLLYLFIQPLKYDDIFNLIVWRNGTYYQSDTVPAKQS